MEASELELFERGIERATESSDGETLDGALVELGWHDALALEPRIAVSRLFEAQGRANVTSSALDYLLASALDGAEPAGTAVVLPLLRDTDPPAHVGADRCHVHGLGTSALRHSRSAVVVSAIPDGAYVALELSTAALTQREVSGLDPALGLVEVTGDLDVAEAVHRSAVDWEVAVVLGQLALGHELVGVARAMLELARQHALERVQFGRTISSFQAVRHRLAESLVAIEASAALLDAAWDDPSPVTAGMAKSLAGRSARTVARHAQQVLAGIGFTTEHSLHRYVRRTMVLDQVLGAGSVMTSELGEAVLASRTLPSAFPL